MSLNELRERLRGPIVPMPTPFNEVGLKVDLEGVRRYTRFLVDNGIQVISPLGTTGEFYTVTTDEHKAIVKAVVEEAAGRAVVIAGCGHSGTAIASQLTANAREIGADAALICAPYYRYDGPEAVYLHYRTIAEENDIPIVIYSNRDVMEDISLMGQLAEIPNVIGVKEATGNYALYRDLCIKYGRRLAILGGGSMGHYLWGHIWGSPGFFASVGNFVPSVELEFFDHLTKGELEDAKRIVREIELPYMEVAIKIGWWRSLKAALDIFGLPGGRASRLPNRTVSAVEKQQLRDIVVKLGLLKEQAA